MNSIFAVWTRNFTTALVFLVPVIPLLVADSLFFPFITGKAFYFRILVEIAFASWLILAFLDARYRPRLTPLTVGISIFALVTLLADIFGVSPLRSIWSNFERMEGWITIVHLWAFFLVTSSLFGAGEEGRKWWRRWFIASISIATIVGIYGVFQIFGWAEIHQGSTRIDASLGNAAYMAVYMLIHAFLAAYLFVDSRSRGVRSGTVWLYGFLAIFFGFLVFQTATRGTILGLLGGIMLASAIYAVFGRNEPRKKRLISAGLIAFIIIVSAIFWLNRDAAFIKNSEVLSRMTSITLSDAKNQARGYIWPMALKGFTERPILGWGQENFNYIFNANYDPKMWNQEQWFDRAHNVYLDWLVAAGIVGFISYIALYLLALSSVYKSGLNIREKSVLVGLIAAYAVHNIFVFDNLASYFLFFAVLGFVNSLRAEHSAVLLGQRAVSQEAIRYVALPAVTILLIIGLYFVNVRPIKANGELIVALQACANGQAEVALFDRVLERNTHVADQEAREQALSCAGSVIKGQYPLEKKQAFYDFAQREINNQIAESPDDARVYTLAGYFLAVIGDLGQSIKFLEKAYELSPKKQSIALQLASVYINTNKVDEALKLFKEAYESEPNNRDAKESYVRALIATGREAEARAQFAESDPAFFESSVVADIYLALKKYPQAIALYEKLSAADPSNVDLKIQLVNALKVAGQKTRAISILNQIAKDRPDLKAQVDEAIKEVNK